MNEQKQSPTQPRNPLLWQLQRAFWFESPLTAEDCAEAIRLLAYPKRASDWQSQTTSMHVFNKDEVTFTIVCVWHRSRYGRATLARASGAVRELGAGTTRVRGTVEVPAGQVVPFLILLGVVPVVLTFIVLPLGVAECVLFNVGGVSLMAIGLAFSLRRHFRARDRLLADIERAAGGKGKRRAKP